MKKVIIIAGPTASGKTAASVEAAKLSGGEIISADSMQIYGEMLIGTARPTLEEMQGIPHHLMAHIAPDCPYSAALYKQHALSIINELHSKGKLPIIVGGTGLYINSLTYDLDFSGGEPNEALREELSKRYDEDKEALYSELLRLDPDSEARLHINNKVRVVRRLEVLLSGEGGNYEFNKQADNFDFCQFALCPDRSVLYSRIDKRVDLMMASGLENEARSLYNTYGREIQAFKAIGYKEFIPYFEGEISLEKAIYDIKLNSRHYAKRQISWFKRDDRITWLDPCDYADANELAKDILRRSNIL